MIQREKLIKALEQIQGRKTEHPSIVQSNDLERTDRVMLVKAGWLRPIIRGWYLLVRSDAPTKDRTVWYAHFWEFLSVYLKKHYKNEYCLSAEASLDILVEKPLMPKKIIILTKKGGGGKPRLLPYDTSLLVYSDPKNIPKEKISVRGLQVMPLSLALCRVTTTYFKNSPIDAEVALRSIRNSSEISEHILKYNLKKSGERLSGAFEVLGLNKLAKELKMQLEEFGMNIRPENPFMEETPLIKSKRPISLTLGTSKSH